MQKLGNKFIQFFIFSSIVLGVLSSTAQADANTEEGLLLGPHILLDYNTEEVLFENNSFQRWHPASITKLLTAFVVFRKIREGKLTMKSPVYYSKNASRRPPSKMGFKVGSVFNIENALKMILVKSANDVAVAIAESVSGSEAAFADAMNRTARSIGMLDSFFVNAHGLHDDNQFSSAHDLALLVLAIGKEFPEHADLFKIEAIQYGKRVYSSYNKLLQRFDGADGMKTGYVCASGFNLAATATRGNKRLVAIVLGERSSATRAIAAAKLLHGGFSGQYKGKVKLRDTRPFGDEQTLPINIREKMCPTVKPNKKKKKKKAKQKPVNPELTLKGSRYLHKRVQHQKPVIVKLGDVVGPSPLGVTLPNGKFIGFVDLPIPTKRPSSGLEIAPTALQ